MRFTRETVAAHTSCVTEHEKYALGATKPGGGGGGKEKAAAAGAPDAALAGTSLLFLAERPPWLCSCCTVTCTSRAALEAHAAGKKHRTKARAKAAAAAGADAQQQPAQQVAQQAQPAAQQQPAGRGSKRPAEAEAGAEDEPACAPQPPAAAPKPVKWKKLCEAVLRAHLAGAAALPLPELVGAAVAAARAKRCGAPPAAGSEGLEEAACEAALRGSRRFAVAPGSGLVTLRAGA